MAHIRDRTPAKKELPGSQPASGLPDPGLSGTLYGKNPEQIAEENPNARRQLSWPVEAGDWFNPLLA